MQSANEFGSLIKFVLDKFKSSRYFKFEMLLGINIKPSRYAYPSIALVFKCRINDIYLIICPNTLGEIKIKNCKIINKPTL